MNRCINSKNSIRQFFNSNGSVRAEEGREPCLEAFAYGLQDGVNAPRARTDRKWVLNTAQSSTYPKLKQWFWFGALWCLGLGSALVIALPIKLLIKACQ